MIFVLIGISAHPAWVSLLLSRLLGVLRRHVLRNALLPVVTMVGMDIGMFLSGTIFVESVFGIPGLGGLLRTSINNRDLPVILGVVMFTTTAILILNLLVDMVYTAIDPRIGSPARATRVARTRTHEAGVTARAATPTA
jgi:ABC-type dipeptide/oligopeptide/nickel transport system permease component